MSTCGVAWRIASPGLRPNSHKIVRAPIVWTVSVWWWPQPGHPSQGSPNGCPAVGALEMSLRPSCATGCWYFFELELPAPYLANYTAMRRGSASLMPRCRRCQCQPVHAYRILRLDRSACELESMWVVGAGDREHIVAVTEGPQATPPRCLPAGSMIDLFAALQLGSLSTNRSDLGVNSPMRGWPLCGHPRCAGDCACA